MYNDFGPFVDSPFGRRMPRWADPDQPWQPEAAPAEPRRPASRTRPATPEPAAPVATAPPSDAETGGEAEVMRQRFLRARADLDNVRKRTSREIADARKRDRQEVLGAFLEVLDNLERALDAEPGDRGDDWLAGIQAIRDQMLAALRRFGAEPMNAAGQTFDPNRHDAVGCVARSGRPEGEVAQVVQTGYTMGDGEVLRPARVLVVQH